MPRKRKKPYINKPGGWEIVRLKDEFYEELESMHNAFHESLFDITGKWMRVAMKHRRSCVRIAERIRKLGPSQYLLSKYPDIKYPAKHFLEDLDDDEQ